jgi:DNA gyrase subunit A
MSNADRDPRQVDPDIEAIVAGARHQLSKHQERAEILRAVLQALDQFEAVYTLVRSSESLEALLSGLSELLGTGESAARAVANLQLLTLAPYRHRRLVDEYEELSQAIADLKSILASPERLRQLVGTDELTRAAAIAKSVGSKASDARPPGRQAARPPAAQ